MSFNAMAAAWQIPVKHAPSKLVLLALGNALNDETGQCDPSAKYLSKITALDRKTIYSALDRLAKEGLISIVNRPGKSPEFTLNFYQFWVNPNMGKPENGSTQKRDTGVPIYGTGGYPYMGNETVKKQERNKNSKKSGRNTRFDPAACSLPDTVNSDAWIDWCDYRSSKRKPISEKASKLQIAMLEKHPHDVQREIVDRSITNDYQGLFPPNGDNHADNRGSSRPGENTRRLSAVDRVKQRRREAAGRHSRST